MAADQPRVAMVCGTTAADRDGVADYVHHLLPALTDAGVAADLAPVSLHPGQGPGRRWDELRALRHRLARWAPDVVHLQFAPSAYGFSRLSGLLPLVVPRGVPLVTTLHEYGSWDPPAVLPRALWRLAEARGWWCRETGRLVPRSRALLTTNAGHASVVARRWGLAPHVVPLAANVAVGRPEGDPRVRVRAGLGLRADAPLIVFFGFVHPVKGLRYLIDALPPLRAAHPGLHLCVAGGFVSCALPEPEARAFHDELVELTQRRGVGDAVTFTGYQPEERVSDLLRAADAAIFPFTGGATTKSGAVLAAMSHGTPTVVTGADPPDPDLVDGETTVVAPSTRSAGALREAVHRVLADPDLRRRVADRARQVVGRRDWPVIAAEHHSVYRAVLREWS
ncbi:glycosyltransferase family 4 protein [Actinoalloteichus caeruleus]|uniref:glycosyltransferase family 4 protein n=3 Tax=Actinoalloteichus cyanogriseus TaxID=2893586 RepID=UPI00068A2715|nr:glycosyltransferase family 4 protein [Actinoalloteichus caeruleus]